MEAYLAMLVSDVLCFFKVNNYSKMMKNCSFHQQNRMDFMLPGSVVVSGIGLEE